MKNTKEVQAKRIAIGAEVDYYDTVRREWDSCKITYRDATHSYYIGVNSLEIPVSINWNDKLRRWSGKSCGSIF